MSYIVVNEISKEISGKILFDKASFSIEKGDKTALVAENGAGKSTLFKVLTKEADADTFKATFQKGVELTYLSQNLRLDESKTVSEEIYSADSNLLAVVRDYKIATENTNNPNLLEKATIEMNSYNAWKIESTLQDIITTLRLEPLLENKISTLSGGQKKRIALAKLLLDDADLLLLDEPTNHLDIEMIEWLGNYLKNVDKTILLITHDRYFLDKVCSYVLELNKSQFYKHEGNYSVYLKNKSIRHSHEDIEFEKNKVKIARELEYIKKSPQGRQSRNGKRVEIYNDMKANLGELNKKQLLELDVLPKRLGNKIVEFHAVSKSFKDKEILKSFDYSFTKGEKIGIVGPNGAGKTTLLKLILDREPINGGKLIIGETVKIGYYSQHQEELNIDLTVLESVKEIAGYIPLSNGKELSASKLLERFLFRGEMQFIKVGKLSGGEKKRLSFLKVLMHNPNFLILDEPTNDFDLQTLAILEQFLRQFSGCVLVVSHDRFFMDQIVDKLFVLDGNGNTKVFPGNYTDYRNSIKTDGSEVVEKNEPKKKENKKKASILYREISKLESKKKDLLKKMHNLGDDFEKIAVLNSKMSKIEEEIASKNDEWLELSV